MSIRPVVLDDVGETSFEDVESTFTYKNEDVEVPRLAPNSAVSTTTTETTTFSNEKGYSSHTEPASDFDNDINYNSDFEEYQGSQDVPLSVDERLRENSEQDELEELQEQLEEKLSLNLRPGMQSQNRNSNSSNFPLRNIGAGGRPYAKDSVRQPRSMVDLATKRNENMRRIPNSRSYMNLRPSSRRTLLYKKSMPSMMRFDHQDALIENDGDDDEDDEDDEPRLYIPRSRSSYKDIHLVTDNDEDDADFDNDFEGIDENFRFDTGNNDNMNNDFNGGYPAFNAALRLSPTYYEIEHDDTLLTPQLHKKHKDYEIPLERYRENRNYYMSRSRSGNVNIDPTRRPSTRAKTRLKTIRQEIDLNTPMKRGKMKYNPREKRWDGNEDILRNFENIENVDRKAFIIKTKRSRSPLKRSSSNQVLLPSSSSNNNDNVVSSNSNNNLNSNTNANSNSQHGKVVGKMKFDEKNLRWVRVDGPEEDPFQGISDLPPALSHSSPSKNVKFQTLNGSNLLRSQSHLPFFRDENGNRYLSSDSTRFHSLTINHATTDPTYQISSKQLEKFYHEENKWSRKVGGWFILGDKTTNNNDNINTNDTHGPSPDQSHTTPNDKSYMYEIRNMVMSSAQN
ncbi:Mitotic check point protein BFA1 [Kluyveromyces marxianus]